MNIHQNIILRLRELEEEFTTWDFVYWELKDFYFWVNIWPRITELRKFQYIEKTWLEIIDWNAYFRYKLTQKWLEADIWTIFLKDYNKNQLTLF